MRAIRKGMIIPIINIGNWLARKAFTKLGILPLSIITVLKSITPTTSTIIAQENRWNINLERVEGFMWWMMIQKTIPRLAPNQTGWLRSTIITGISIGISNLSKVLLGIDFTLVFVTFFWFLITSHPPIKANRVKGRWWRIIQERDSPVSEDAIKMTG